MNIQCTLSPVVSCFKFIVRKVENFSCAINTLHLQKELLRILGYKSNCFRKGRLIIDDRCFFLYRK